MEARDLKKLRFDFSSVKTTESTKRTIPEGGEALPHPHSIWQRQSVVLLEPFWTPMPARPPEDA